MTTRTAVVEESRTWLGTPWKHQGRLKGAGVDCAGLVVCVAKAVGIELADSFAYSHRPRFDSLKQACELRLTLIPISEARAGDVLLFTFATWPGHVGILSDDSVLIHAYEPRGKVVEHRMDKWWWSNVSGAYKLPGVEE